MKARWPVSPANEPMLSPARHSLECGKRRLQKGGGGTRYNNLRVLREPGLCGIQHMDPVRVTP